MKEREGKRAKDEKVDGQGGKRGVPAPHWSHWKKKETIKVVK